MPDGYGKKGLILRESVSFIRCLSGAERARLAVCRRAFWVGAPGRGVICSVRVKGEASTVPEQAGS